MALRPRAGLSLSAVLSTGSVSCLDFLPSKAILAAGFSDIGRVQLWRKVKDSWISGYNLTGHSHGIRTITSVLPLSDTGEELMIRMNSQYLVSAGADKVLVVWDIETGQRVARFGQQPNISAGLHLFHDSLISITIDGLVRAYDIGKGELVRQFKICELGKQVDLADDDRKAIQDIGGLMGGTSMVQWASGSGSMVTVGDVISTAVS